MMQVQPWVRLQRVSGPLGAGIPVWQRRAKHGCMSVRACSSEALARPPPWLLVGLGNPGSKYQGTRHNVGFEMIDAISQAEGIPLTTIQHKSLLGKGHIEGTPVLLAKPQTYVNLSGESVGPIASYYKIPVNRVFVIYDDLDLEFAVMRMLPKGGHGGHNG